MKLSFTDKIGAWAHEHKKLAYLACFLLCCAIVAGGWFGWRQYQYMQTSQYAFEKLKQALTPPDTEALAHLVDFRSLSGDLSDAISKSFPFYKAGPDQQRNISHILQTALLQRFLEKEKTPSPLADMSEEDLLKQELRIMPPDFLTQLIGSMALRETSGDKALISAKIENPILGRNFTIMLGMNKTRAGWRVDHVANAREMVMQLRDAMLARHAKLRHVFVEKNAATTKKMNQLLPIQSCTVDAGLLSDHKTLLMVVNIIARNQGQYQVNNFNVDTSIYGKSGKLVLRRYLNTAKPVAPGEDFDHRWNFELEASSELGRAILANAPLQCKAAWQTLGVNNGEVWHIVEVPNPDRQCSLAGHDHPEGFCQTPVFLR